MRVRSSLRVPAWPDHAEHHVVTLQHRELHEVTPRPRHHLARRAPEAVAVPLRRHRPRAALRQRNEVGMRPTEQQRQTKQLHLMQQAQPAVQLDTTRHPPTLLLAATRQPQPPRLVRDAQHLRR